MTDSLASLVAPTGTLRVVLTSATRSWPGVPLHLESVGASRVGYAAITEGSVDLCLLAVEPAREEGVASPRLTS